VDGDRAKAGRRECGVCWNVYDPAVGDPLWQVPPGTAFEDLPAHWSCPNCAAEQSKFLVLPDE
jgi:rubredoxin